jgi:hypothetical protein
MNKATNLRNDINAFKINTQNFVSKISSLKKEDDNLLNFYNSNIKKLGLQLLDLTNALERQISFYNNQNQIVERKLNTRNTIKK